MISYIEYVYEVYVNKSFSKAARNLYISQPSLSATIKKVEKEIGFPIFDRSTNPISLTEPGKYYIKSIEKILQIKKEMKEYFDDYSSKHEQNIIKIGAASFLSNHILPEIIQSYEKEQPRVNINLFESNKNDLDEYIKSGKIDMLIDVEEKTLRSFDYITLSREEVLLAVPVSYEINSKLKKYRIPHEDIITNKFITRDYPEVNLSNFKKENFLLLKPENDLYKKSIRICEQAGFSPKISMQLDQTLSAHNMAKSGEGVTFIRLGLIKKLEGNDKLYFYKINDTHAFQDIVAYYDQKASKTSLIKNFIDYLNKSYNLFWTL